MPLTVLNFARASYSIQAYPSSEPPQSYLLQATLNLRHGSTCNSRITPCPPSSELCRTCSLLGAGPHDERLLLREGFLFAWQPTCATPHWFGRRPSQDSKAGRRPAFRQILVLVPAIAGLRNILRSSWVSKEGANSIQRPCARRWFGTRRMRTNSRRLELCIAPGQLL